MCRLDLRVLPSDRIIVTIWLILRKYNIIYNTAIRILNLLSMWRIINNKIKQTIKLNFPWDYCQRTYYCFYYYIMWSDYVSLELWRLRGPLCIPQMILSSFGMILTGENQMTRGGACPNATLSTTDTTWTALAANRGLRGEKPAPKRPSYGTTINMHRRNASTCTSELVIILSGKLSFY